MFRFIFVLVCASVVFAQEIEKDEGIFVLTTKNYEKAVKDYKYLLVEFHAPWCGHCKALGPEYVKAAQELKEKDSEIKLAKVDGTEEQELVEKLKVKGYPTLFFYRDGEPIDYTGGRMANEIVGWVEKKTGPPAETLETAEKVKDYIDEHEVAVIGFFKDPESEQCKKFQEAVRDYEEYPCAITSDEEAFKENKVEDGQVVLFKKFDEGRAVYEGAIGKDALRGFIEKYALQLVTEFNHDSAQKIFADLNKSHMLFFISKTAEDYQEKYDIYKKVAEDFRFKVMFVVVDLDEDDHRRVIEFLGLKNESMPTLRIIRMTEMDLVKYKPETNEFSEEAVRKFAQDYLDKKVPVHYLSEDIPEDWDKNPVKILVGKNFDQVAFNKDKNVLVQFYAPWCGHCKQLAPVWDEVAEFLTKKEDVLVAKMDSTVNELPHTKVRSFPTIKLYKKTDNEEVEYNGERTLEGITKFLASGGEYGKAAPDHDEL